MDKLKKELKQLKIQIRVGIDQKQISQDWGILLLDNLEEAINYTRCCKSDNELLLFSADEIVSKINEQTVLDGETFRVYFCEK